MTIWVCVDNVTQSQVYSKMTKEGILLRCDYEHIFYTTNKEMNIIETEDYMDAWYIITICRASCWHTTFGNNISGIHIEV